MAGKARIRVGAYVTRRKGSGEAELLVFDHQDFPHAGTQVPAGGVEAHEPLGAAVRREVREETGVDDLVAIEALAVQQRPHPTCGQERVTVFFHAETSEQRDGWTHVVTGDEKDQDSGLVLRCYFVPSGEAAEILVDAQGEFLPLATDL